MSFEENLHLFSRFSQKHLEAIKTIKAVPLIDDPLEEVKKALVPFLEKKSSSIAVYGLSLKNHYLALKEWLLSSESNQLIFVEDDFSAIKAFLQNPFSETILKDPQVSIALILDEEDADSNPVLVNLSLDFFFLAHHKKNASAMYGRLLQQVYSLHAYISDLWLYKEQANFYYHLTCLDECFASTGLETHFPKIPFVICGAGPSLNEQLPLIHAMKDKAFVFPSGTGINILNDAGVDADLGAVFDPKLSGLRRCQSSSALMTPFFIDLDSSQGTRYLHGPKILTAHFLLGSWKHHLLDALGIKDQIIHMEPSVSSTHYILQLGLLLKIPAQVLLGIDLAYVKGAHYSGRKTWLQDEDSHIPFSDRTDFIEVVTKDHRKVITSRIFYKESAIYASIAEDHPEQKIYDGSNDGQGIIGVPHRQLDTILFNETDIKARLHEEIFKQLQFHIPLSHVRDQLLLWKKELEESPKRLLESYLERLALKFALKKRFLNVMKMEEKALQSEIDQFCNQVICFHLKAIDAALVEIDEKLAFPASTTVENEGLNAFEGVKKYYYKDGPIYSVQPEEGVHLYWYQNGVLKAKLPYFQGKLEGKVELYYDNGQLKMESAFLAGKREGSYSFFFRSGSLKEKGFYQNGIPFGLYEEWNREGKLEKKIYSHLDGKFDLTEWDETGNVIKEIKSGYLFAEEMKDLNAALDQLFEELS